jgi:4-hydroxybenzoate polyprenyltransferase
VKNFFVFIPAFFAGTLLHYENMLLLAQGFASFCLVASSIYILNDYRDIEVDRQHPVKKNRPLASGSVSPSVALVLMVILMGGSLVWSWFLLPNFFYLVVLYLIVNIAYSLGLKNLSLVDIFLVSSGFLIRTIAGGVLIGVFISQWLIIMVFLLSLLMAFAKRRDDLVLASESGKVLRKSSAQYTVEYINTCLSLIAGIIMVSYIMYTLSEDVRQRIGENYLYITSLFVFAGLLRYLQIALVNNDSGSPTRILLTDRFIQVVIVGWILVFIVVLYV